MGFVTSHNIIPRKLFVFGNSGVTSCPIQGDFPTPVVPLLTPMPLLRPLVLIVVLLVLGACSTPSGDCGPFPNAFKTTGFETSVHQAQFRDSPATKPMLSPITEDTLRTGHLAIQMQTLTETYYSRRSSTMPLQLLSSARACSPVLPTSDEVIQDIRIYSTTAFGDEYSASDNLSALFDIVMQQVAPRRYRRFDLNEFLSRAPNAAHELILILKATPPETTRTRFTVEYEQEGKGLSSYSFRSPSVVLSSG